MSTRYLKATKSEFGIQLMQVQLNTKLEQPNLPSSPSPQFDSWVWMILSLAYLMRSMALLINVLVSRNKMGDK
jgi:hypothetical protein